MATIAPGERLKEIRVHLGLTTREVEGFSHNIATTEGNGSFYVSHGRLVQIENNQSIPGVYKLMALSVIYGRHIVDLLSLFVDLESIERYQLSFRHHKTRPVNGDMQLTVQHTVEFPIAFHDGASPQRTGPLSEFIKIWGHIPVGFLRHISVRHASYGVIGLSDYMMYPLLRPGSIVQIDEKQKSLQQRRYVNEFERPIYFLASHSQYLCCWCEVRDHKLIAIPHPLSACRTQEFRLPEEVEVVGRVVAVAARLDETSTRAAGQSEDVDRFASRSASRNRDTHSR